MHRHSTKPYEPPLGDDEGDRDQEVSSFIAPPPDAGEPIAYSYVRFSTPEQMKGDSLPRQTRATAEWCARNKVTLDASTTYRDLGVSAFKGAHRTGDKAALGAFLKLVERGKIPKGSYLIIENLDRLSREDERTALRLWMDILDAGINIVQLSPETVFRHEKSDMFDIMRAIMELGRGHGESAIKSERVGAAWADKKACAREGKPQPERKANRVNGMDLMTHSLPSWVEERGGKLALIPEKAAAVRRIFQLAAQGYGRKKAAAKLKAEGVAPISKAPEWNATYLWLILHDRRAVGEHQPRRKHTREPDGPPIPGYFPAAVTEGEWLAARAGAAKRRKMPGRVGNHVNVFAGLLKSALDGMGYSCTVKPPSKGRGHATRMLINNAATEGKARFATFPFETFEQAVLSCLREIDPHEILNGDDGPDEALVLGAQWERIDADIKAIEAELDAHGESPTLYRRLRAKEAELKAAGERLAVARQKAANPLSAAWGEAQTLLGALDAAPDPQDARLRLQSALRQIIEGVWMIVVPGPRGDRLCAVQIWFAGGKRHRDYLILHRPMKVRGKVVEPRQWWARSLADAAAPRDLDLRDREQAAALAEELAEADLEQLAAKMAE
jgi:DNA invertase Pin-like site-specific DNA recombinase